MTSAPSDHSRWTAPGSDATAQKTYAAVRAAIESSADLKRIDMYLQGSYANSTNIRADSDVDVVVQSNRAFFSNKDRLSASARQHFDSKYPDSDYLSSQLRIDVQRALDCYFGSNHVVEKGKCIRIANRKGYVDADVVPVFQYRFYTSSDPDFERDWVEGVAIHPLSGGTIVNFPKSHKSNGELKNSDCGGRYKPTVRQIKRLRNRALDEGRLSKRDAPGYLLECMTFNSPPGEFVTDDSERLREVLLWLKFADKSSFRSCDGVHLLFGDDPGEYSQTSAQAIIDALWDAY